MKAITLNVLCIFLLLFFACSQKEDQQKQPQPPDITLVVTAAQEVPIYQEFIGQIYGFKDIAIRARVEGFLERLTKYFEIKTNTRTEGGRA